MKQRRLRLTWRLLVPLVALVTAAGGALAAAAADDGDPRPLRIMITNDDGITNPGLRAIRDALCDDGHDVTVVAPASHWSGIGAAIQGSGEFVVAKDTFPCGDRTGHAWALDDAYPADTVYFGMAAVFADNPPDLVVSGINPGQNVGRVANHSGTVGAAITATHLNVPAIAVSVEIDLSDRSRSQTFAAMAPAAAFTTNLISELQRTKGNDPALLPQGTALTVNYPIVLDENGQHDPDLVGGPKLTVLGETLWVTYSYVETAPGVYKGQPRPCAPAESRCAETKRNTDTEALAEGHVTITPLDADWTASKGVQAKLSSRIANLVR